MKYRMSIVWMIIMLITASCNSPDSISGNTSNLPPSPDISVLVSCEDFLDAFHQELKHINYCSTASQCGQVLKGTSCGCSRDKVARADADSKKFYDIISLAKAKQCSLPLLSTCDCPATDGFACVENQCNWNFIN